MFSLVRFGPPESAHAVGSMKSTTYAKTKGNVHFVWFCIKSPPHRGVLVNCLSRDKSPTFSNSGRRVFGIDTYQVRPEGRHCETLEEHRSGHLQGAFGARRCRSKSDRSGKKGQALSDGKRPWGSVSLVVTRSNENNVT